MTVYFDLNHFFKTKILEDGFDTICDILCYRMEIDGQVHIIPLNLIEMITIYIFAPMGVGKTTTAEILAYAVEKWYGQENVNTIYTSDLYVAYQYLDDRPVQLLVIDDAMRHLSARQTKSLVRHGVMSDFYELRHIFEEKRKNGILITIFISQSFASLDALMRDISTCLIIKSYSLDPEKAKLIGKLLKNNKQLISDIQTITEQIYRYKNQHFKGVGMLITNFGKAGLIDLRGYYDKRLDLESKKIVTDSDPIDDMILLIMAKIMEHENHANLLEDKSALKGYIDQEFPKSKYQLMTESLVKKAINRLRYLIFTKEIKVILSEREKLNAERRQKEAEITEILKKAYEGQKPAKKITARQIYEYCQDNDIKLPYRSHQYIAGKLNKSFFEK